jgi:chorismate synthase
MSGSTFGKQFRVTTCGESHGVGLACIIDGCPAGLQLSADDIQIELDRRRPGQSTQTSQRRESDTVSIISGVFEGATLGTPIGLMITNDDAKSKDYDDLKDVFRPGHADFTYQAKYGVRDHRGGGRASARETAMRVAAGAIAKKFLKTKHGIEIRACLSQLGEIQLPIDDWAAVAANDFLMASSDPALHAQCDTYLKDIRQARDSIGAAVRVEAIHVPAGLGEPVFDKCDALIAQAMMSINAVKAVAIGDGFAVAQQRGSDHRDAMTPDGFESNHAGGVLGGITSGQTISVDLALKPASSIPQSVNTVDSQGQATTVTVIGRHDPCVGIRAVPIAEAMLALVLMDLTCRQNANQF